MFVKVCNQNIKLMLDVLYQYYGALVISRRDEQCNIRYRSIDFRGNLSLIYSEMYDKLYIADMSGSLADIVATSPFVEEIYMIPLRGIDDKNRLDMIFVLEPDSYGVRKCFYYDSITGDFMKYKSLVYISALSMFVAFDGSERLLYFYLNNEDNGTSVMERLLGKDTLNIGSIDNSIPIKSLLDILSSLESLCIRSFAEKAVLEEWLKAPELSAECSDKCSLACAEKYAYSGIRNG